jgi:hypothetical protein
LLKLVHVNLVVCGSALIPNHHGYAIVIAISLIKMNYYHFDNIAMN